MNFAAAMLVGEIWTAPVLMAIALTLAFVGSVGIGVYIYRHTPERFQSAHGVEEIESSGRHAA